MRTVRHAGDLRDLSIGHAFEFAKDEYFAKIGRELLKRFSQQRLPR
jgi:hypothetical protein